MRQLDIYQVDAFTSRLFGGNPAAVCPLKEWLPDAVMQAIAMENNLSETAFFVPRGSNFELRWFTPAEEVDLCGHATLAAAHVLFNHLGHAGSEILFHTRQAGDLHVRRDNNQLVLDFPARAPEACAIPAGAVEALGSPQPLYCGVSRDLVFVYENEDIVRNMKPDFHNLLKVRHEGQLRWVIVTAPGKDCDFVSRFFCVSIGIDEDPVTGSAHCTLVPYWAKKLGKTKMFARQVSARGGELHCELKGDRVFMAGEAVTYLQGKIFIPNV
ncbi:MAG TPA: PhzF family phenazine biosynthesis protein [Alphaproteobacteria bacterium]|nr:PhzF family phenazine biosynthesis protein [Alphaproteobacteria bacterium]